jgi:copper(I)-binding protein
LTAASSPIRAVLVAATLLAAFASAHAAPGVSVTGAWVRTPPVPTAPTAAAYFDIVSAAGGRLVAVSSSAAATTDLHEMKMEGDIMRMRALPSLPLPAGQPVKLSPGGNHVMLTGLKAPLKTGDTVTLTLTIEDASMHREQVVVKAPVQPSAPSASAAAH